MEDYKMERIEILALALENVKTEIRMYRPRGLFNNNIFLEELYKKERYLNHQIAMEEALIRIMQRDK